MKPKTKKEKEIKRAVELLVMSDLMPKAEREKALQIVERTKRKYKLANFKGYFKLVDWSALK